MENIAGAENHAPIIEKGDLLLPKPVDIEGFPGDKMNQSLLKLSRADEPARAPGPGFGLAGFWIDFPDRCRTAFRANCRKRERLAAILPVRIHHLKHLGDHVSGALDPYPVADAHIMGGLLARSVDPAKSCDVVRIVEGGVGDHHAAHRDGRQSRYGGQRARSAHLNIDAFKAGNGLFGGEFVGDSPARRPSHSPEPRLPVEAVHLVHNPIDFVGQIRAVLTDPFIGSDQVFGRVCKGCQRIGWETPVCEGLHGFHLGLGEGARRGAPGIGEEIERAGAGHFRVQLAESAGCRIARIYISLSSGGGLCLIQRCKRLTCHEHLTPDLNPVRPAGAG